MKSKRTPVRIQKLGYLTPDLGFPVRWLVTVFTYKDWNIRFEGPPNYVQRAARERRIDKGRKFDFG
jgi:hypothetical protein